MEAIRKATRSLGNTDGTLLFAVRPPAPRHRRAALAAAAVQAAAQTDVAAGLLRFARDDEKAARTFDELYKVLLKNIHTARLSYFQAMSHFSSGGKCLTVPMHSRHPEAAFAAAGVQKQAQRFRLWIASGLCPSQ